MPSLASASMQWRTSARTSSGVPKGMICWFSIAPWKQMRLPELPFQLHHVHPGAGPLHGVEDVDPHLDQERQEGADGAVVVMEHLDAELVAQVDEAFVMGRVEFPVELRADQRPALAAQVVGHLGHIDEPVAGLEHAAVVVVEEIGEPLEQHMGELRIVQRVDQRLLQAAQQVVVVEGRHVAALDHVGLAQLSALARISE